MDRRKLSGAALALGLLLLVLALGGGLLTAAWKVMYEADAIKMGMLTEQYPREEASIAAVFNGKQSESVLPSESGSAGNDRYQLDGIRLFQKYGYTLGDSIRSGIMWRYALAAAALLIAGVLLEILILVRNARKTKTALDRAEFLEQKLQESLVRAEQVEEQLRREEQDTKSLITDISHQLKTPLASLKMSYELADSTVLSIEERREFVEKEREEVAKLESLLTIFTQLTRLETGMIHLQIENSSLKETLTHAVNSIYMKAYEKHIDIAVEEFCDVSLPHDPRWTSEVILNILDNAVKYSPADTEVFVRVSELASYVIVEVEDQGIGIPASQVSEIFKRFCRGDAPEVKNAEGSGVGLYLARKIIEQQGGTICVKPGASCGSNFILTLPKQQISPVTRAS